MSCCFGGSSATGSPRSDAGAVHKTTYIHRALKNAYPITPAAVASSSSQQPISKANIVDYIGLPFYISGNTQDKQDIASQFIKTLTTNNIATANQVQKFDRANTKKILTHYKSLSDMQPDVTLGLIAFLNDYGDLSIKPEQKQTLGDLLSAYKLVMNDTENETVINELGNCNKVPFFFRYEPENSMHHYTSGLLNRTTPTQSTFTLSNSMLSNDLQYSVNGHDETIHSILINIFRPLDYHKRNGNNSVKEKGIRDMFENLVPSLTPKIILDRPVQQGTLCGLECVLRMMDSAGVNIRHCFDKAQPLVHTQSFILSPTPKPSASASAKTRLSKAGLLLAPLPISFQ